VYEIRFLLFQIRLDIIYRLSNWGDIRLQNINTSSTSSFSAMMTGSVLTTSA